MNDLVPATALLLDALLIVVMTSVIVWREARSWRSAWRPASASDGKRCTDGGQPTGAAGGPGVRMP